MGEGAEPFEAGQVLLGKLRVIRVLGEGGMGAVYEVEHALTKHRRALKVLHPRLSRDADVTRRLLREASVAGTLRTKHVVETFDAGQLESGAAYVLMEMLEGEPLADLLARRRLDSGRLATVFSQVCAGLTAAHAAGIIHRDLKPDNIFVAREVDGTERVKLLDFGISKFSNLDDPEERMTAEGLVMGTPYYMSPEQTKDAAGIDARTDIYALGVILYEALAGRPPFVAETFPQLFVRIHLGQCDPLAEAAPDAPAALVQIVEKAMALEAADRYQTASELRAALGRFKPRDSALGDTLAVPSTSPPPAIPATAEALDLEQSPADDEAVQSSPESESTAPVHEASASASTSRPALLAAAFGALALAGAGAWFAFGGGADAPPTPAPVAAPPVEVADSPPPVPVTTDPVPAVEPEPSAPPDAGPPARTEPAPAGSGPGRGRRSRRGESSGDIAVDREIEFPDNAGP